MVFHLVALFDFKCFRMQVFPVHFWTMLVFLDTNSWDSVKAPEEDNWDY